MEHIGNEAEGIVYEVIKDKDSEEQTAKVFLLGVYDIKLLDQKDELKNLPIMRISLDSNSSGSSGSHPALYKGQRVLCRRINYVDWEITGFVQNYEKKDKKSKGQPKNGGSNQSTLGKEVPTSVKPTEQNDVNPSEKITNKFLVQTDLPALATANINRMIGSVFSIVNNDLQKMETIINDVKSLSRELNPEHFIEEMSEVMFHGIISTGKCMLEENVMSMGMEMMEGVMEDVQDLGEIPFGYVEPKITAGIDGMIDLTKDYMRSVDVLGGNIGNIRQLIKIDGWPVDLDKWEFKILNTNIKNPDGSDFEVKGGHLDIPSGLEAGVYHIEYILYNKSKPLEFWQDPVNMLFGGIGSQFQPGVISFGVVPDMLKVDFNNSISFLDSMKATITEVSDIVNNADSFINDVEDTINTIDSAMKIGEDLSNVFTIGAKEVSKLVPQMKFESDPKTTDKSTYSQVHILTGPGNSVSLELDFTTGPENEKEKGTKKE